MYDPTTVQGSTFDMRGQLHHGHANASALSSSPVVSSLGFESDDLGSSPSRGKALCPWDVQEKKMRAPLLGLAKSIHYSCVMLQKLNWAAATMRFSPLTKHFFFLFFYKSIL